MTAATSRVPVAMPPEETPEERDERTRGNGYTERCRYWESLTERQIAGLDPMPSMEEFLDRPELRPS